MQSASEGARPRPSTHPSSRHGERRSRYRRPFHNLVYVKLVPENGGILRDISDKGAALNAVAPLQTGQTVQLRFDLLGPNGNSSRTHMDVEGSVAWATPAGQAGVQFRNLAASARRQLNEWIFAGMLASITQLSPVLSNADPLIGENLQLAPAGRAPIAVAHPAVARHAAVTTDEDLLLNWLLDRLSPRALSLAVDGLVLSVASLLFLVIALAVTKTFPGWLGGLAVTVGVLSFCTLLYRGLFRFMGTKTAGGWLAELAMQAWESEHQGAETAPRFR